MTVHFIATSFLFLRVYFMHIGASMLKSQQMTVWDILRHSADSMFTCIYINQWPQDVSFSLIHSVFLFHILRIEDCEYH